jgi:hypothetical protein
MDVQSCIGSSTEPLHQPKTMDLSVVQQWLFEEQIPADVIDTRTEGEVIEQEFTRVKARFIFNGGGTLNAQYDDFDGVDPETGDAIEDGTRLTRRENLSRPVFEQYYLVDEEKSDAGWPDDDVETPKILLFGMESFEVVVDNVDCINFVEETEMVAKLPVTYEITYRTDTGEELGREITDTGDLEVIADELLQ